jgi:hypothetical protein
MSWRIAYDVGESRRNFRRFEQAIGNYKEARGLDDFLSYGVPSHLSLEKKADKTYHRICSFYRHSLTTDYLSFGPNGPQFPKIQTSNLCFAAVGEYLD